MTNNKLNLNNYKQEIADLYTRRSVNYDNSAWHLRIAHLLVEYAQLTPGQSILDIATGTGMVAIEAARIVGSTGNVIGIDISSGMLEQARQKVAELEKNNIKLNIEFQLADAEALDFPINSFDQILCASAFIWMQDIQTALIHWAKFIKPGGIICFHAFADTAFIGGIIAQKVATKYGINLEFSKPTGTVEKCRQLLNASGFEVVDIKIDREDSGYISLEKAKLMWAGSSHPAPGQYPNPLSHISLTELTQLKVEYDVEIEALNTEEGVWNDVTTFMYWVVNYSSQNI
ncbi:MAG: methyltransferase domain-containing protein [Calothrix sp. CSU_2_0]|nr:methyltransferase domain-containing protein [Calothrix sp. CSU_2_0]